ncbi:hypothetical protein MVES1_001819 [Malassezia vespertilionis]|uniref:Mitochondrial K+-H+ exchange-related-domain-containing protein n=1 Tax=Malassezia vespertilionis TaxID=2020962 RepID=A0A2N1JD67_9BASI|nr:uncharacterized protein MVES1_001819 [Malassezia vespertilionis]PKI84510.1 hypothetical protein MVES_001721 [Malassezia vespertilionis]WFD06474.1 hypothetical protein MVES1_001819 [Malassezia vespertilionis]
MRILAVPLARQCRVPKTYYTYIPQESALPADPKYAVPQKPLLIRMSDRASAMWLNLGRKDVASTWGWRRRLFLAGERLMDRIHYEEWELKGIARSFRAQLQAENPSKMALVYPPAFGSDAVVQRSFSELIKAQGPFQYRWFVYDMIGIVVSSPLFLVPVVPNVLTYYIMWRAWSHWQACRALTWLENEQKIEPKADSHMDTLLDQHAEPEKGDWQVILHRDQIVPLAKHYALSEHACIDLFRAQEQMVKIVQDAAKKSAA